MRPVEFQSHRISDVSDLSKIIKRASVSLRGWDFPHMGTDLPSIQGDWIRSEVDWEGILESWVFFQSAAFLFLGNFRDDWRDASSLSGSWEGWEIGKFFNVHDVIFKLTEVYEFATRLISTVPGNGSMIVEVELVGLANRHLYMSSESNRHMRWQWYKAELPEVKWGNEYERTDLMANSRSHATKAALEIFKLFKWDAPEQVIKEIQGELRR